MLTLDIDPFLLELKDGALKNVGPPNKTATVKLFDVESASARDFGDKRIKLEFVDEDGNECQVSLFPNQVRTLRAEIETLEAESPVFGNE